MGNKLELVDENELEDNTTIWNDDHIMNQETQKLNESGCLETQNKVIARFSNYYTHKW